MLKLSQIWPMETCSSCSWVLLPHPHHSVSASLLPGVARWPTSISYFLVPGISHFSKEHWFLVLENGIQKPNECMRGFQTKRWATELGEATAVSGMVGTSGAVGSLEAKSPAVGSVSLLAPKCFEPRDTLLGSSVNTWLIYLFIHWLYLLFDNKAKVNVWHAFSWTFCNR